VKEPTVVLPNFFVRRGFIFYSNRKHHLDRVIMSRAIIGKPQGGLAVLGLILASLSGCGQSNEGAPGASATQPTEASAPVVANYEVTSIDAAGNVAPFGFASREPVDVPPLETAPAQSALAVEAGNQSAVFAAQCSACHSADASGVEGLGVSLVDSELVKESSADTLIEFLKVGRLPNSPDSITGVPMPGFSWMNQEQLAEVAGYVKQL
jgi:mono/diheme cytochrome c family protein